MAIGINDLSKNTLGTLQFRQDNQLVLEQAKQAEQKNAKVIHESADSNAITSDKPSEEASTTKAKKDRVLTEDIVNQASQNISQLNMQLSFKLSEGGDSNIVLVLVLDKTSGDVVRQIPSEEFVKMSERIGELVNELGDIKGTLVNNRA